MKTAKLGALFLISVLALAGIGVGYATWADTVDIDGRIETGRVEIGIRHINTNDPGQTLDPRREVFFGGAPKTPDKHVATTTGTNGAYKCEHSGNSFYASVSYLYENVYPGYAPSARYEICNSGTLPVHLTFAHTHIAGNTNIITQYMDLVEWNLYLDGVWFTTGNDAPSLDLALQNYQLHPCHRLSVEQEIHFYTNALPQNDWVEWTITVTGTQWNE